MLCYGVMSLLVLSSHSKTPHVLCHVFILHFLPSTCCLSELEPLNKMCEYEIEGFFSCALSKLYSTWDRLQPPAPLHRISRFRRWVKYVLFFQKRWMLLQFITTETYMRIVWQLSKPLILNCTAVVPLPNPAG